MSAPAPRRTEAGELRMQLLPVKLTEAEVAIRAQELAAAEGRLSEAEKRLERHITAAKAAREGITEEIQDERSAVRHLAEIVRARREDRDVPVVEEQDFDAGAVHTVRTDTGEVVATRGMTPDERQRSLFRDVKARKTAEAKA
jgi:hypothetical protein